jgi:hypothetical protein
LGRAEFAPGDSITITNVQGTRDEIAPNETYAVEGSYTLTSHDEAVLAFYATTSSPDRTPTDPRQVVKITKGQGTFRLVKTMHKEGYPHVSFYPGGNGGGSFGEVYFGRGPWVFRGHWSFGRQDSVDSKDSQNFSMTDPNRAMFEYLGHPVPAPSGLDARYTTDGLRSAVQQAAASGGLSLQRLVIDDSEFPGIIGIVIEQGDIDKINDQIKAMAGYEYNGSISSSTCKVFCIVPERAFPSDLAPRIHHRLGLRERMLHHRMTAEP